MELMKKRLRMNRWKASAATQLTLDDDFIVPDTLDDMEQIMLDTGEIQAEAIKGQGERVLVRGKLDFQVLYRGESGGLQTMGGSIPFEETVNVAQLTDGDHISLSWTLEDLQAEMIHSRKLGVKAILTLNLRTETEQETEAAVEAGADGQQETPGLEILKRKIRSVSLAVRKKDTYRIRKEISLTGGKPNIGRLLWQEMRLRELETRPQDGSLRLDGELLVFVIYQAEEEGMPVQWLEEVLPFSGELELPGAGAEQIPMISASLSRRNLEMRQDYDGEMRELSADAALELDIRLYEEKETELLSDLYSNECEITPETGEALFDQLIARNVCRVKIAEKIHLPGEERVLQICHSQGAIRLDEVELEQDGIRAEGVLEVTLLYLTSDDRVPVRAVTEQLPFHCRAEAEGADENAVYQLEARLEQLGAVMAGGDTVEIRGGAVLDFLVLRPVCEPVITGAQQSPQDMRKLQELPGIVGYVVQPEDRLWDIAKRFHTTIGAIQSANELPDDQVKPGQRLLLVKEVAK